MKENEKKERRKKRRNNSFWFEELYEFTQKRRAAPVITLFSSACHASRVIFKNHDHADFFSIWTDHYAMNTTCLFCLCSMVAFQSCFCASRSIKRSKTDRNQGWRLCMYEKIFEGILRFLKSFILNAYPAFDSFCWSAKDLPSVSITYANVRLKMLTRKTRIFIFLARDLY